MSSVLGSVRRLLMSPSLAEVTFAGRGFPGSRRRLPGGWRWSRSRSSAASSGALTSLTCVPPTMTWLAVDGYGFDRAYFEVERYVTRQERLRAYPWQGRPDYFARAVDQGVGRALWFIH